MSLFGKKYDPNTDLNAPTDQGTAHLQWVVKPGVAQALEPKQKGAGGTVVVLPYPDFDEPDYQAKNLVCQDRLTDDPDTFVDQKWWFLAEGVRKFGKSNVTLLFDNPDDSGFSMREHHPAYLIREAAWQAKKGSCINTRIGSSDSDGWVKLLDGDEQSKQYGCLPRPDKLLLCNVLVYALGKETYDAKSPLGGLDSEPQVVWVVSRDCGWGMLSAVKDHKDHPIVTGAKVFHFYDRKAGVCQAKINASAGTGTGFGVGGDRRRPIGGPGAQVEGTQQVFAGYDTFVTDSLTGLPGDANRPVNIRPALVEYACRKIKPWEEVLRGHTPDQCAQVIANHCNLPASLLVHAWKSNTKWYTEHMQYLLTNPVSANFGGTGTGNQAPQTQRQEASTTGTSAQPSGGMGVGGMGIGGAARPANNGTGTGVGIGGAAAFTASVVQPAVGSYDTYPHGTTPFDGEMPSLAGEVDGADPAILAAARKRFEEAAKKLDQPAGKR